MPHVVTQPCCGDASCVFACPVNAIHPTPDEPDFISSDMVYIDPKTCVDCGACVPACPVGAIKAMPKLTERDLPFVELNRIFHEDRPAGPSLAPVPEVVGRRSNDPFRVAIVGAGPAAMYAADEVLKRPNTEVTVFDRLPAPYGLVRSGVAPDHPDTRTIDSLFRQIEDQAGFRYMLGVEVGTDVSHAELAASHDAVVYATGASLDRKLGIEGEQLPGSATATDFVAWYNGHPDHVDDVFDMSHERAVIVGNGNVALDVARILATEPERLEHTDIADYALEALRGSAVREVILLARRGPAQSAFTLPEITSLVSRDDIEVVVEGDLDAITENVMDQQKIEVLRSAPVRPGARRIVLRYQTAPVRIVGDAVVSGVDVARTELVDVAGATVARLTDDVEFIETGMVLRSVGYRGRRVADLPFDEDRAIVPNSEGRVDAMAGTYVVGWIKRGPSGFIGTNKTCAAQTIDRLFEDFNAGVLRSPDAALSPQRFADAIDREGWRSIDEYERRIGIAQGRVRARLTDPDQMRAVARASRRSSRAVPRRLGRSRRVNSES